MQKKVFFVFILIFTYSCNNLSVEPDLKELNKYGLVFILHSWSNNQFGVLTKTNKPIEPGNEVEVVKNFVDSANVTINGIKLISIPKDSVIRFNHNHNITHLINYYTENLNPEPEKEYELKISLKGENLLTGSTILPPKVKFTKITQDEKFYYVHWETNATLKAGWALRGGKEMQKIISGASSYVNFAKINKKYVNIYDDFQLRIYTFDNNLTKYKSKQIERSGINNQFGVFGSITRTIIKIKFN